MLGDQFNYYPVPYELFVLCMRMHTIIYQKGAIGDSSYYFAKIINKAMSALTLLEDNFLSTAYLPCRTALEVYLKLLVLRNFPELFEEDKKFLYYETIQTCRDQEFPEEFNQLFVDRKNKKEKELKNEIVFPCTLFFFFSYIILLEKTRFIDFIISLCGFVCLPVYKIYKL